LILRQAEAFAGSGLRLLGLDLFIRDHTTLTPHSRNFAGQRPRRVSYIHRPVHLVDGAGLKLFGQGEWHEEKHGGAQRSWRKIASCFKAPRPGEIVASVLTGNDVDDAGRVSVRHG
jgi:hypothetical protein